MSRPIDGRVAAALATWFGCGYSPVAPGTAGTLAAVPLHLLLRALAPWWVHAAVVGGITAAGVWASGKYAHETGDPDPQRVVIDEVAGTLLALMLVRRRGFGAVTVATLGFRVLDILKPGPVGAAERVGPPGVSIMLDDLVAGLGAGLIARVLSRAQ